ncbi:MAG: small multi-drug export protein [Methanoregulaceae archaeon]|nr:small multi-drug export protein [Methanoregulaceae archaeon]
MRPRDLSWLSREKQDISRRNTYIRILIPPLLAVLFFIICIFILPRESILILGGLMIAYFIPPSGKESIIPIGIGLGIPWWLMALTLTLLDVITALFMIMNFALMIRVPRLGPWIEKTTATGREFMAERPWMARWRIPGVAFFVMLPLQGTGGVGATVVGLMAGLTPGEILLAVGIGAAVESLAFALGWGLVRELILANMALGLTVALAVIAGTILLMVLLRRRFTPKSREDKKEML